jgi:dTDP-4-amino-4,6-dideoxygalactose transaminase
LKYGDISTLSFHATKVFNTIEGGAIFARDECVLEKVKLLRNHGILSEEEVVLAGTNAKMNEFQAAMGLCNLEDIDEKIGVRKKIYDYYTECLDDEHVRFQKIIATRYNYSYMPVCFENKKKRDQVYLGLLRNGIASRKYFYPLTTNAFYFKERGLDLVEKYHLDRASDIADGILCLPICPDLELYCVENIVKIVNCLLKEDY